MIKMIIFDGHIHIKEGAVDADALAGNLRTSGVNGAVLLSQPTQAGRYDYSAGTAGQRLDNLFSWTDPNPNLYPFYWIDPTEPDALEQVERCAQIMRNDHFDDVRVRKYCNHFLRVSLRNRFDGVHGPYLHITHCFAFGEHHG